VMVGTNLTQAEVEGLEAAGFKIDSGEHFDKMHERILARSKNAPPTSSSTKGIWRHASQNEGQLPISLHCGAITRALCEDGFRQRH
jgi:hypothetical protein